MAGLIATTALAQAGYRIFCCAPNLVNPQNDPSISDNRVTALLNPSIDALREISIWNELIDESIPLEGIKIAEISKQAQKQLKSVIFLASDCGYKQFGWIINNTSLTNMLFNHLVKFQNVTLCSSNSTVSVLTRRNEVSLKLSNGSIVRGKLLVAADGRNSTVRRDLGIGIRQFRFNQKTITFNVLHDERHRNISTEIYQSGGPFTFVPINDYEGKPASSIVWMDTTKKVDNLLQLSKAELQVHATRRSHAIAGQLKIISNINTWPSTAQHVESMIAKRTALIAEAAHVVPPIGAQGLNMSIADINALIRAIRHYPDDPGSNNVLNRYQRYRFKNSFARLISVCLLNRVAIAGDGASHELRKQILRMFASSQIARTLVVKQIM